MKFVVQNDLTFFLAKVLKIIPSLRGYNVDLGMINNNLFIQRLNGINGT